MNILSISSAKLVAQINRAFNGPRGLSDRIAAVVKSVFKAILELKKKVFYTVSLGFVKFQHAFFSKKFQWYNQILPQVFLGALPLKERGDLDFLKKKAVLSLVEPFEFRPSILATPLTFQDYSSHSIQQKHIKAVDYQPLTLEQFQQGVEFIEDCVKNRIDIYVHCKAGRGRSAATVIAYLVKNKINGLADIKSAIEFVKSKRSQIRLNHRQQEAIGAFLASL